MIIPDDMISACGKIFDGEYDLAQEIPFSSILDIGANIGAFAIWATYRYPNAKIYCYEPIKVNYELLIENTKDKPQISCHNVAVGAQFQDDRQMYYGGENRGQCSFFMTPEQRNYGEKVSVIPASSLPVADLVKLDVEGAELEILENMAFKPKAYVLEYHSPRKRRIIREILRDYTVYESKMENIIRGSMKLVRTDVLDSLIRDQDRPHIEF